MTDSTAQLETVRYSVDLSATPDQVWDVVGHFGGKWHPLIAEIEVTGEGVGQVRTIDTTDGSQIVERLEAIDDSQRLYSYAMISGIPALDYVGTLEVEEAGAGSKVTWRVDYRPAGAPPAAVEAAVAGLINTGLDALKLHFGTAQ
jgi:hypothetical protein